MPTKMIQEQKSHPISGQRISNRSIKIKFADKGLWIIKLWRVCEYFKYAQNDDSYIDKQLERTKWKHGLSRHA